MSYKINELVPTLRKGKWVFDQSQGTIITQFQTGHGFTTSGADASSNVNDTTPGLPVVGTQCATVVSAGAGASAILQNTSITSIDTTNLQVIIVLKVDDITHLSSLDFSMGNSGFTNEYHVDFANAGVVSSSQWVVVSLVLSDAQSQGSPTRSGITAIRMFHKDDNTGNKVTIHYNGIYFMPNTANQTGTPSSTGFASICFDDGFSTQWDTAKPLLDSKGLRASLFIIKDQVGLSGRLTLPQIQSLQDQSGWEVNMHAYTDADHSARDTNLTPEQLLWDKSTQKEWLLANGLEGQGYAYPGGVMNQAVVQTARRFSRYARGTQGLTETYPFGDPYRLKSFSTISTYSGGYAPTNISTNTTGKIDLAVANGAWLILTFHKIIPPISSLTMSGNIATITFSGNHTFSRSIPVTLSGFSPSGLNGNFTIASVPSSTTITVNIGSNPGNSTVQGTALTATTDCDYNSYAAIVNKLVSSGIVIKPIQEIIAG